MGFGIRMIDPMLCAVDLPIKGRWCKRDPFEITYQGSFILKLYQELVESSSRACRGRGSRTPSRGFGDRWFTVNRYPYNMNYITPAVLFQFISVFPFLCAP